MADENWQKVRKVFDEALRQRPEERRKFVHEACGADKLLLAEVESLLTSLDGAESFLETPAVAQVADVIEDEINRPEAEKCFGHYEIIRQIGAGGMGEVYLAQDQKLDRQVAVKILNKKFRRDEANLNRFIQEAKAASALNHPNILVIHEIGSQEEAQYIVSEFIRGKTLREVLKAKTLKLSEILDISIQIASALIAAHEARLVHRDIKPENIMIRHDDYVKVLDFGLAKLVQRKNKSLFGLDNSTVGQNQTARGVILGTVNYMSPEQAKGEPVDERTDVFSLGVVIYEMIAGKAPFAGESVSETFANLINKEPQPLSQSVENTPEDLQRIVSKMLCKDKDERYQTMKHLISDLKVSRENLKPEWRLEELRASEENNKTKNTTATTSEEKKQTFSIDWNLSDRIKRHRKEFLTVFCVVLIAAALTTGFYKFSKSEKAAEPFRQIKLNRLTNTGNIGNFALSPDGNLIAYETREKEGISLWVRQLEMSNAINLFSQKKGNVTFLTFSPDGKLVYYGFFSGYDSTEEVYSVPALGGASRRISHLPLMAPTSMSFAPDGKHFAHVTAYRTTAEKVLAIVNLDTGEEIRLAARKSPSGFNALGQVCAWSPDGKIVAVMGYERDAGGQFSTLVGVSAADGAEKPLSAKRWNELKSLQWLKDGSGLIVIGSDAPQAPNQIWFVSIADGKARMLTNDLNDYSYAGVTPDGKKIVAVQESRTSGVWLGTFGQDEPDFKELISETGRLDTLVLTASENIVFRSNADGEPNLWTIGTDGGGRKQITVDAEVDGRGLCAAPDGRQIVFPSQKAGKMNLWRVDAAGGDARQLTFGDGEFFPACLPNNLGVIYQKGSGYGIKSTLWKIFFDGGEAVQLTDYYAIRPAVSPDNRRVAFFYIKNGKWSIGIVSADGGAVEQTLELPDGVLERTVRWSPDGQSLFYISNEGNVGNLWSLPLDGQSPKQITNFNSQKLVDFVPTQNGKKVALTRTVELNDVVVMSVE